MKSSFLELYQKDAVESLMQMNPNWDEDDLSKLVKDEMKDGFSNPSVVIDNNFKADVEYKEY